jgi:hypothetical protein
MKHSPTEAKTNERIWRRGVRANAGEAHINEGILPETHTKERCGRAEGLELEAEFGATEHTPAGVGAHERAREGKMRADTGDGVGTDRGHPGGRYHGWKEMG